jgi:quinoprotein relay system zinc metallohydrolase 2
MPPRVRGGRSVRQAAAGCFAGALTCAAAPAAITQVAPGDFVRPGVCAEASAANRDGIANTGFIIGADAVAVIDPGGSLADGQSLRAALRAKTNLPIRYVIMTHDHPDHVFGGGAFAQDHAVFVGHWRMPAGLASRAAYDHARLAEILGDAATGWPTAPTLLVHGTTTLDLGHRALTLQSHDAAHTDTDLTILDQATKTLWTGDLVFSQRVPALDGNLTGWISTIGDLQRLPAARAVPGHGPASLSWPDGANDELRYLSLLRHDVRAAIASGRDIPQTVTTAAASERTKWALFDAYNGRNATEAFRELQWE